MKRIIFFLCLLLVAVPVSARIVYHDDCEDAPDTVTTDGDPVEYSVSADGSGGVWSVSDYARAGSKSYKVTCIASTPTNGGPRAELIPRAGEWEVINLVYGEDYWYSWSLLLPPGFVMFDRWNLLGQWHKTAEPCDQCPRPASSAVAQPVAFELKGTSAAPYLSVGLHGSADACMAVYEADGSCHTTYNTWEKIGSDTPDFRLKVGSWNDIVFHWKPAYTDGAGIFEVWLNGKKIISTTQSNVQNDVKGPYPKFGIYTGSTFPTTVYYDEIRFGIDSSYAEMSPGSPLPQDTGAPVRSAGSPTGTLDTAQAVISLTTNEAATCKYSTVANTAYPAMTNTFSTTGGMTHSRTVGLTSGAFTYFIRCEDTSGNSNTDDYAISFSVATSPVADKDSDGCVSMHELVSFIDRWKRYHEGTMTDVLGAVASWKNDC